MERLSGEQERFIRDLLEEHEPGTMTSLRNTSSIVKELADAGYLTDFKQYLDGGCRFIVGSKCKAYFEQIEREEEGEKEKRRHDWKLNIVNGIYAVVGAVLGAVVGFVLGRFF